MAGAAVRTELHLDCSGRRAMAGIALLLDSALVRAEATAPPEAPTVLLQRGAQLSRNWDATYRDSLQRLARQGDGMYASAARPVQGLAPAALPRAAACALALSYVPDMAAAWRQYGDVLYAAAQQVWGLAWVQSKPHYKINYYLLCTIGISF